MISDTHPEIAALQRRLLRQVPPARKLALVAQMNQTVRTLAWAGLRSRYPAEGPEALRRRLVDLLLGPGRAAGWVEDRKDVGRMVMVAEPVAVTLKVTAVFERLEIPYLIGGSLASALYGVVRATLDADLVADIPVLKIAALVAALQDEFYIDAGMILDAVVQTGSFNLIHLETAFKVDVFLLKARPFDQNQLNRRVSHRLGEAEAERAFFSTAEDIILAKLEWFRAGGEVSERQWRDILGVLELQWDRLDWQDLHTWAAALGVQDLLQRAIQAARPGEEAA